MKVRVQIEEAGTRLSLQEARRIADIAKKLRRTGISCTGFDGVDDRSYPRALRTINSLPPPERAKLCLNWSRGWLDCSLAVTAAREGLTGVAGGGAQNP